MRRTLFTFISVTLLFWNLQSNAQRPEGQRMSQGGGRMPMEGGFGTLKGTILDETTNLPVEYANIIIYKMRDSSMVTGGITDLKGNFSIDKIPFGRYYIDFKFIGYKNSRVEGVAINPKQPEVTLDAIKLKSVSENIEGVTVTGQKSMIQHNLDKKVINVDRAINAEGGTALDIMRNIPSVEVDVQGNVSLRGSSNLTILVDGKPSQIVSLEELPSSIVQSVEVITNPSVRYDPDGMSGILNIVLKKKKTPGYHGMVSLNAGTGNKYSGTVNMNMRQGKLNFFGNFDYRHFYSIGSGVLNRIYSTGSTQNDNQNDSRDGLSNNFRGGIDYFINPNNTLSFSGSVNVRNFDGNENSISQFNSVPVLTQLTDNASTMGGKEMALNYKKTFNKPGQEFSVDAIFSSYNRNTDENTDRIENGISNSDKSNTEGINNAFTFQSDLVKPVGNGGRVETGIKGIIRKQDGDFTFKTLVAPNDWQDTANISNRFILNDQIYAGYLIYSNSIGPISYQGGVRIEDQLKTIDQRTDNTTINVSLFNYFPSAHIKWELNKVNALQVSYSKRVNRPSGRVLNPFIDKENIYNPSFGNPYLKPEFTSSYELGHSFNLEKTNINSTLFYRRTTDKITEVITEIRPGPTEMQDTLMTSYMNLSSGSTAGLEVVISQTFTKWWKANGSFSFFNAKLDGYESNSFVYAASESNSWTAKVSSSFTIVKNLELQLNANYRSPVISGVSGDSNHGPGGQGKTEEIYWLDLGMRYNILKNKATITLRVSDVFNTRQFKSNTFYSTFSSFQSQSHESQIVFLGFSYRINDYKQRQSKIEDMGNDMEE